MIPKIIEVLKQPQYRSGLIMDGFPRTIKQAEALEEVHAFLGSFLVFSCRSRDGFHSSEASSCKKAHEPAVGLIPHVHARVCPKCNRSYILSEISEGSVHLPAILPQNENLCDDCNVPLVVRSDDNPKIIEARYDIFEERTKPVLEFYREKKILCEFGIKQGVQDLPAILRNILIHFLSKYNWLWANRRDVWDNTQWVMMSGESWWRRRKRGGRMLVDEILNEMKERVG